MSEIDVVIPIFNGERYIERALDSLRNQTYTPNKVIVVDDGSTDSSLERVKRYQSKMPQIILVPGRHRGVSAARNIGITSSRAKYIAFLDCDDYWAPEKLENQVNHFKFHPNCTTVFSNCIINDEIIGRMYPAEVNGLYKFSFTNILTQRYRVIGSASSICIARKVLDRAGFFDETLHYGEDYELWVRISRNFEICEISNKDVFISNRENSVQTSKNTGASRFNNATAYLTVWSRYSEALKPEKRELERVIFTDMAKALIASPKDNLNFHKFIKSNYPEINTILFSRKIWIFCFYLRNFAQSLRLFLKLPFRKNFS